MEFRYPEELQPEDPPPARRPWLGIAWRTFVVLAVGLGLVALITGCAAEGGLRDPRAMTVADWCVSMDYALAAGMPFSDHVVTTWRETCL